MTPKYSASFIMISIHALREEGDHAESCRGSRTEPISIHALREEGDSRYPGVMRKFHYFYPRPPRGGRRQGIRGSCVNFIISIHALREEGDILLPVSSQISFPFLSTPSARRATTVTAPDRTEQDKFLSTPSARRATAKTEKNISAFVSL